VNNLTADTDEQTLRLLFAKYGELKDIRIVTYRNGHSKGCAYVEFRTEADAQAALQADGTLVKANNISVAISDPQKAKMKQTSRPEPKQNRTLGSASFIGESGKMRINAPMIPSSVRRQQQKLNSNGSNPSADELPPSKSNADFRAMLTGSK